MSKGPSFSLSYNEAEYLSLLVQNLSVLEIGSFQGFSTYSLCKTAREVWALDTFCPAESSGIHIHDDTLSTFLKNMRAERLSGHLTVVVGNANTVLPVIDRTFDVVFHDGPHDYEQTFSQVQWAFKHASKYVAVHDYTTIPTVKQALDDLYRYPTDVVESLAIFKLGANE